MRLYAACLVLVCAGVAAQYEDDIGVLPQRAFVPGQVGRQQFRNQRIQARVAAAPSLPLRVRRPIARVGRLPTTPYLPLQEVPLSPTPPTTLAQPRPLEVALAPRPIEEIPIEEDEEELDELDTIAPQTTLAPTPTTFALRPQHLQPAVFRPARPILKIDRPPVFRPAPLEEDIPVPTRQQYKSSLRTIPTEDIAVPTRQQFRNNPKSVPLNEDISAPARQIFRPSPRPTSFDEDFPVPTRQQFRPSPRPTPLDEDIPVTTRQQFRPSPRPVTEEEDIPVPTRQQFRPQARPAPVEQQYVRQPQYNTKQEQTPTVVRYKSQRTKKPVAQVIRKYREDNADGSITWGYENDDGSFKEETIGVDCVVRGKYGYVDPDGLRREYNYNSGIPCDKDQKTKDDGFYDPQNDKYVLPNGDAIDLESVVKNRARKPTANVYRN